MRVIYWSFCFTYFSYFVTFMSHKYPTTVHPQHDGFNTKQKSHLCHPIYLQKASILSDVLTVGYPYLTSLATITVSCLHV